MIHSCFLSCQKLIHGLFLTLLITPLSHGAELTLDYIGQQIIPHNGHYKDTIVGGLSSLDYHPETDRFIAICDDRSSKNPARFYELKLDYDLSGFYGWEITNMHFIKRPDGTLFPKPEIFGKSFVDPEALRLSPAHNSYFWASEGHTKYAVNPLIREMDLQGAYLRDFIVPKKYMVGKDKGIRNNMAFEAMTLNRPPTTMTVSTEGPLIQDGAKADINHGAPVRFLHLDLHSGQPRHEYVYMTTAVHKEILPFGNFSINGVTDILALSATHYVVIERTFSAGVGLSVRLYLADFTQATDVLSQDSLKGISYQAARKELLLDLSTLGIPLDNIEGMSFGKVLKDGRRSLILISDNNFRSAQVTQILIFAIAGM